MARMRRQVKEYSLLYEDCQELTGTMMISSDFLVVRLYNYIELFRMWPMALGAIA